MDFDTSNWLPIIFLLLVFFVAMILGFLESIGNCISRIFSNIWNGFLWFFGFGDYGFGYDDYSHYHRPPTHNPYQQKKKCLPHLHKWVYERKEPHKWSMVDGKPTGTRNHLDNVISVTMERPGHTETKLSTLLDWRKQGFNVVFTSWNYWKCNICCETKRTEFYDLPYKEDPATAPPILTLSKLIEMVDNSKKQTQQINTFKREFAVEPVKWYK